MIGHTAIGQHGGQYPGVETGQDVHMMQSRPQQYTNYRRKQSLGLGVLQIIVGVLCIIFNAVAFGFLPTFSTVAHGVWGGILFIITGSFGVSASKSPTKCKVITFMVLCIISACVSAVLVALGILGALFPAGYCSRYNSYNGYYYGYSSSNSNECNTSINVSIAMNSLVACLGLIEGIAAIWGSANGCKASCCCDNNNVNTTATPVQFVTLPNGQQAIIIPQTQMYSVSVPQQSYPGQVFAAYPDGQGYPNQHMPMAAPPYEASPSAPEVKTRI
jgi:hypothetical protein